MEKYCLLKEWIFAGPFQKDVSSLYENNYNIPRKPYLSALQEMEKKMPETLHACEGEKFELFGQSAVWEQLRLEETEKKVTVAGFGTFARAMVSCACCDIIAMEAGEYRFRFYTQGIAAIAVNGEKVYSCGELGFFSCTQTFMASLRAGNNRISVFLFNVHIHCVNSFALEIVDTGKWESRAPLAPLSSDRDAVLSLLASFYLNSSLSLDGEPVFLCTDRGIPNGFSWSLCRRDRFGRRGETLEGGTILKGRTEIPITSRRGEYLLCVDYTDPSGIVLKGRPLSFEAEYLICDLPNEGNEKRKRFLTETYTLLEYVEDREAVYQQLACLESGRADLFREEEVMRSVRYVNARYDCADFAIHGVLRLYAKYGTSGIFSEMLLEEMKKCILSFQYAQDENGKSMMFMRSENHAMLFYSAEYLAGLLFPKEVFSNSGQNGLFHIQKGKAGAARWIREKGTWGFSEWHSNTYYEENIISLLDIWEFGEEYDPIHHQSKALLDFICLLIASHSLKGIMAVTHGRCYEKSLIYPILEGISHINWLLFGVPDRLVDHISMGAAALLSGNYQAPEVSKRLAVSEQELFTRTRMGLFPQLGTGGVSCSVYRTKHYMVSGMAQCRIGEKGIQVSPGQVLLEGKIPVFVSCFDTKSKETRPSYWCGQRCMPRTIHYKSMLAFCYHIPEAGYTHCYFPLPSFEQTGKDGCWLFGSTGNAYIALYADRPVERVKTGEYRDMELLCLEKDVIWLMECGDANQYGSFEEFKRKMCQTQIRKTEKGISYTNPSGEHLEFGWDLPCTIDNRLLKEKEFPLFDNNAAFGEYGEGIILYRNSDMSLNFRY